MKWTIEPCLNSQYCSPGYRRDKERFYNSRFQLCCKGISVSTCDFYENTAIVLADWGRWKPWTGLLDWTTGLQDCTARQCVLLWQDYIISGLLWIVVYCAGGPPAGFHYLTEPTGPERANFFLFGRTFNLTTLYLRMRKLLLRNKLLVVGVVRTSSKVIRVRVLTRRRRACRSSGLSTVSPCPSVRERYAYL